VTYQLLLSGQEWNLKYLITGLEYINYLYTVFKATFV